MKRMSEQRTSVAAAELLRVVTGVRPTRRVASMRLSITSGCWSSTTFMLRYCSRTLKVKVEPG